MSVERRKHICREVQACRRSCYRTFNFRVDSLISGLVTLLSLTVKIWRYWQFAYRVEQFGKRHSIIIPREVNTIALAYVFATLGTKSHLTSLNLKATTQSLTLPFLQIAYHAKPRANTCGLEHLLIVGRQIRLKQKDFDECAGRLAEVQTGLDYLGVVEHHKGSLRQMIWNIIENIFRHLTMLIKKQLAVVALRKRELGNTLVGQRIIVVFNMYMFCFHFLFFILLIFQ